MDPIINLPDSISRPVVASIPHGGEVIPDYIISQLLIEPGRNYADWYTADLYDFLPAIGIPTLSARLHRLVADANRSPSNPAVSPWPKGIIATTSVLGDPIYSCSIGDREVQERIAIGHTAYHRALDDILNQYLSKYDALVLVDLHSFGMATGVDIVIGDANGRSASPRIVDILEESFTKSGFSIRRNNPFSGGWIVRRFIDDPKVHSVIIELNQRLYADPDEIDRHVACRPTYDRGRIEECSNRLYQVFDDFGHSLCKSMT